MTAAVLAPELLALLPAPCSPPVAVVAQQRARQCKRVKALQGAAAINFGCCLRSFRRVVPKG